jgi:hypothetical protein
MRVDQTKMPGFHGQGLTFVPEPGEIKPHHQKDKGLQAMSIVQSMSGLTQGAEQIARDKYNAKKQDALIEPATQASKK